MVDAPTKDTIFDWFQYREVCDNDKFDTFFNRTLNKCWRKYQQLLRIQPGEEVEFEDGVVRRVNYDWMVQEYKELQHTIEQETTGTETSTGNNTVTRSNSDVGDKTVTMTGQDVTDRDTTSNVQSTGSSETSDSRTEDRDLRDHTVTSDDRVSSDATSDGRDHSGSNDSDDRTLAKAAPQSISYGSGGFPATLDWQYPGSQSEVKHDASDSYTEDGTSSTSSTSNADIDSDATHTGDINSSSASMREDASESDAAGTEDTTFDTTRATIESDSRVGSSTESGSNDGSRATSGTLDSTQRELMQGRSIDIATLLENAKNFILGSSAWDFLYGELDKCFISIYND